METGLLFSLLLFQTVYRVEIQPLDFQDDNRPETHLNGVTHLDSDGETIALSDHDTPWVLLLDRKGQILGKVGTGGPGPNEINGGVFTFGMGPNGLWVMDSGLHRLHFFSGGEHQLAFSRAGKRPYGVASASCCNQLAFDNASLVIANTHDGEFLGAMYDYGGNFLGGVGPVPFIPEELRQGILFVQSNMWVRGDDSWFCALNYRPMVFRYDANFKNPVQLDIDGPEISHAEEELWELAGQQGSIQDKRRFSIPNAFYTDAKYFQGHLYLLSLGCLYQIHPKSGEVLSRTYFYGTGADFAFLSEGANVSLWSMAFINDGTIVMGSPGFVWNHDLWTAKLPHLKRGE